jgi:hypothetical protein
VRLAGAWVLVGACLKLFLGTPADLPALARELPLALGLVYRLAIAVELSVAALALLAPRRGWLPLLALLLLFDAALVAQIARGETSCGCFGAKVVIAPAVMLAIDSALLLFVLAGRPWRTLATHRGAPLALLALAVAVAVAVPWILDREDGGGLVGRGYVDLDVARWAGKKLDATPLAGRLDLSSFPDDGLWILYRDSCEDCAALFEWIRPAETGQRPLVLIRLPEVAGSADAPKVKVLPEGDFVHRGELPDDVDWLLPTPGVLAVRGRCVLWARDAVGVEAYAETLDPPVPEGCR